MTSPYKIVLADDHRLFRQGIRRIIEDMDGVEIVAEAGDGLELLDVLKFAKPDLVVLDISMPKLRGIEAAHEIKAVSPRTRILVLTMHKDLEFLRQSVKAGVEGYLLKEDADTELIKAIEAIRKGHQYITPILAGALTRDWLALARGRSAHEENNLTVREREVLKLFAEGLAYTEIADELHISVHTVYSHRANIMRKVKTRKPADLVKYAIRQGLVPLAE